MRGWLLSPDGALCLSCGKLRGQLSGLPLCPACARELVRAPYRQGLLCPRCRSVMKIGKPCPFCARDKEGLLSQTFAPYRYHGAPRSLVLSLKFRGDTRAAALLAPARVQPGQGAGGADRAGDRPAGIRPAGPRPEDRAADGPAHPAGPGPERQGCFRPGSRSGLCGETHPAGGRRPHHRGDRPELRPGLTPNGRSRNRPPGRLHRARTRQGTEKSGWKSLSKR